MKRSLLLVLLLILAACGGPSASPEVAPGTLATSTTESSVAEPTRVPEDSPEPAATEASPTEAPTEVPPEPTVEPTPIPPPLAMSGSGNGVTEDFTTDAPLIIVESTHDGSAHFAVTIKNAETAEMGGTGLAANLIGPYNGRAVISMLQPGSYFYEVNADGNWTVTTLLPYHLETAPEPPPYTFTGNAGNVSNVFRLSAGRANFTARHSGTGHFGVTLYNASTGEIAGLIANEIGATEATSTVAATDALYLLGVQADGEWSVEVSQ